MFKNYKDLQRGWVTFEVRSRIYYLKLKGTDIIYAWTKRKGKLQRLNISSIRNKHLISAFENVRTLNMNN